jgi:hypothetical protein
MRINITRGALATAVAGVALVLSACSSDSEEPTATAEPTSEPTSASGGGASVTGLAGDDLSQPMGPGISVSDALAGDQIGPILVNGFVLIEDGEARLCESLAESFPPQCGGPSLVLDGFDPDSVTLSEEQGVRWTDDVVQVVGVRNGGTLEITAGMVS